MELVSHAIPAKVGQEIILLPIGDIQFSGRDAEVAMGMLKRHIQWGVDRGAWFLGMGDYIDFMSPSNRARYEAAGLYDTTKKSVDDKARSLVEDLWLKALKPSKGRWLGLLEGHHFHEYRDGTTSDQELAGLLDAPFLGSCAFVRLMLQMSKTQRAPVTIWCHHGVGGGVTLGAPLNKLERLLTSWDADIYLMGHHHKKVAGPIDRIEPVWSGHRGQPGLVHRTKIIACTGSFLKGYVPLNSAVEPASRSWVRDALADGPVSARELKARAAAAGISEKTLGRAADALGVSKRRKGYQGGSVWEPSTRIAANSMRGSYVEQKMLNPVALGGVLVKIKPRWADTHTSTGWIPDLNVEL